MGKTEKDEELLKELKTLQTLVARVLRECADMVESGVAGQKTLNDLVAMSDEIKGIVGLRDEIVKIQSGRPSIEAAQEAAKVEAGQGGEE